MTKGDPFNRIPEERSANTNFTRKRERRGGRNENGRRKERRFKKSRRFSVYPVNSLFPLFENCFRQPFRKLVNKDKNLGTFGEMVANRKNSWKLVSWAWMGVRCYSKVYKKKKKKSQRSYRFAACCNFNEWTMNLVATVMTSGSLPTIESFSQEQENFLFEIRIRMRSLELWYKNWGCDSCLYILIRITVYFVLN